MNTPNKNLWLVGDFPSTMDIRANKAFSDSAGEHLDQLLASAGLSRDQFFIRLVTWEAPPRGDPSKWFGTKGSGNCCEFYGNYVHPFLALQAEKLRADIAEHKPRLILAVGNVALWAITNETGITNWRGSMMRVTHDDGSYTKVIPIISPAMSMKLFHWSYLTKNDLKRVKGEIYTPTYQEPTDHFIIRPSFEETLEKLDYWIELCDSAEQPVTMGVDVETRFRHITCIGIADTPATALCVPLAAHKPGGSYWHTPAEEYAITVRLRRLLGHPNFYAVGQNINYDRQYIARDFGIRMKVMHDTMTQWHICFPGLEKSLSFICSMVLPYYVYWKDEGKGHAPDPSQEDNYWLYNCKDAARTLEAANILEQFVKGMNLTSQYNEHILALEAALDSQLRGIRQNVDLKSEYALKLMDLVAEYDLWFKDHTQMLTGGIQLLKGKPSPWWRSPKQQMKIFYELFKVPLVRHRKTGKPTVDDDALTVIGKREPLLKPFCDKLTEYRSIGVFLNNFALSPLDWDERMRCSFGVGMTETFRWTSSEDAFGFGSNLQNLPKGNKLGS